MSTFCGAKREIFVESYGESHRYFFIVKASDLEIDPPLAIGSDLPTSPHKTKSTLIKSCNRCSEDEGRICDLSITTYNDLNPQTTNSSTNIPFL